jgi:hypothetical protein
MQGHLLEQIARNQLACRTRRASSEHRCPIYNVHMAVDWRFAQRCGPPLQITVYGFATANQHAPQHAEPPTDLRQSFCKAQSSLNTQRRCPNALEVQHRPTRPLNLRLSWRLHAAAGLPGPCGRLPWLPVYLLYIKQSAHADMWHGKLIECVENASLALLRISRLPSPTQCDVALLVARDLRFTHETMQSVLQLGS